MGKAPSRDRYKVLGEAAKTSAQSSNGGVVGVVACKLLLSGQTGRRGGRTEGEETTGQHRHIGSEVWQRIKALFQTLTLHPDMGPDTGTGYDLIASENL